MFVWRTLCAVGTVVYTADECAVADAAAGVVVEFKAVCYGCGRCAAVHGSPAAGSQWRAGGVLKVLD